MTNEEKRSAEAYYKALDSELEALVAEAEADPHEFSPDFEKRMDKLLGSSGQRRAAGARRVIAAVIAAVFILTAAACAVPGIRRSVVGFIISIFEDHEEYTDFPVTKQSIEEEYGLVPIPEGLREKISSRIDTGLITEYSDETGVVIKLIQSANGHMKIASDNVKGEHYERIIDGKAVRVYVSEKVTSAIWVADGYLFQLDSSSSIDFEQLEELIRSVRPK